MALLAWFAGIPGCGRQAGVETVVLGGEAHRLELAVTNSQIQRGMMFRDAVPDRTGMLFVFPDLEVRSFWMKNCRVPLDAIFMDDTGTIVSIRHMAVPDPYASGDPPSYSSFKPAQFVIEIRAGEAARLGLAPGDQVDLPLERLKKLVD